jgi:hypothetical protein
MMERVHSSMTKPASASPILILLHIEKTAGMTTRGLFCRNVRDRGCVEIQGINDNSTHADWEQLLAQMRAIPLEQLAAWTAYHGNVRYGFHKVLPGPARYITFLRDPLQRIVSRYQMLRRLKVIDDQHRIDISKPEWNLSMTPGFTRSFDNWQTRVLAGLDRELPFGGCREEHFQAARENLDRHFDFVGLTERLDISVLLLNRLYRWPWRFFIPHNVAPVSSPLHADLPDPVLDAIRELNQYDYRLYAYAQKRLEDAVGRAGLGLSIELRLFSTCNAIHRVLHYTRHAFKRKSRFGRRPHGAKYVEIRFFHAEPPVGARPDGHDLPSVGQLPIITSPSTSTGTPVTVSGYLETSATTQMK